MTNEEYRKFERQIYDAIFTAAFSENWEKVGEITCTLKSQVYDLYELGYKHGVETQKA